MKSDTRTAFRTWWWARDPLTRLSYLASVWGFSFWIVVCYLELSFWPAIGCFLGVLLALESVYQWMNQEAAQ